jgi:antitoxin component of RelBE/YafQ-DinJ toxin-antitoxin module
VPETEKPVFVRGRVPESVRARFKASCALQGRDMSEVLEELIKKWLEEHEIPAPPPTTKTKRGKGSKEVS